MPRNTSSRMFFYVYVLQSLKDLKYYIGLTHNLNRRIEEHEKGLAFATKFRVPFKLVYFEGYLAESDAREREKQIKQHGQAIRRLKDRIRNSLKEQS